MSHLRIGVRVRCLRLPPREAIQAAASIGLEGVQLDAVGPLAPGELTRTGRRDLVHLLRSTNLEAASVAAPNVPLGDPDRFDTALAELAACFELSREVGSGIVTVLAGRVPDSPESPAWEQMSMGVDEAQRLASHVGGVLALETGAESAAALGAFLEQFDSDSVGVNLDPANLVIGGFDPIESTRRLGPHIVHTHVKDVRRTDPLGRSEETPFGQGAMDWPQWLAVLAEADYHDWMVIETAVADPVPHVAAAAEYLSRL